MRYPYHTPAPLPVDATIGDRLTWKWQPIIGGHATARDEGHSQQLETMLRWALTRRMQPTLNATNQRYSRTIPVLLHELRLQRASSRSRRAREKLLQVLAGAARACEQSRIRRTRVESDSTNYPDPSHCYPGDMV